MQTARNEDFIMKPSVDWCFKELMRNPKTRKGFIAVLLQIQPEEIGETILLENELPKEAEEESYSTLKKCIQVSVLNFERFPDDGFCYRTIHFWDEMAGKRYIDKLEI